MHTHIHMQDLRRLHVMSRRLDKMQNMSNTSQFQPIYDFFHLASAWPLLMYPIRAQQLPNFIQKDTQWDNISIK